MSWCGVDRPHSLGQHDEGTLASPLLGLLRKVEDNLKIRIWYSTTKLRHQRNPWRERQLKKHPQKRETRSPRMTLNSVNKRRGTSYEVSFLSTSYGLSGIAMQNMDLCILRRCILIPNEFAFLGSLANLGQRRPSCLREVLVESRMLPILVCSK